ncbi:MAG: hypothetical protein LIO68_04595 [Rikenellaceae bacterium]|nr:hypothetical protein [Rikenellaceae bacterium]
MIFAKKMLPRRPVRRWLCAAFGLAVLLCPLAAAGQHKSPAGQHKPRQSVQTRQKFLLDKTIFVTSDFEHRNTSTDFAKWLRSQGAAASNAYNKARNRITFVKVNSIEGAAGNDAWQISVKTRRITVAFTSENALRHAVEMLEGMVVKDAAGNKYIQGGILTDWGARTAARDHDATADAASSLRPVSDLEAAVKRLGGRSKEVYLILVSTDNWRMESPSLETAGLANRLYPADGYYSTRQLQQLAAAAKQSHIEIIPTLELFSENRAFTAAFGHSVFSVEGMRLVRAAIEDCIEALHPAKICLGSMSPQADMRYMEFISDLASMLGVELVIIES